jgi:hypothetical protein
MVTYDEPAGYALGDGHFANFLRAGSNGQGYAVVIFISLNVQVLLANKGKRGTTPRPYRQAQTIASAAHPRSEAPLLQYLR